MLAAVLNVSKSGHLEIKMLEWIKNPHLITHYPKTWPKKTHIDRLHQLMLD